MLDVLFAQPDRALLHERRLVMNCGRASMHTGFLAVLLLELVSGRARRLGRRPRLAFSRLRGALGLTRGALLRAPLALLGAT